VNAAPDWGGARKQTATFVGEPQDAAASIVWVWRHFDQAATFKGLQSGSERGSIHCEQRRYWPQFARCGSPSPSRWRWASAPTPPSSAWCARCCCGRWRIAMKTGCFMCARARRASARPNATFSVPEIQDIGSGLKTIQELGTFSEIDFTIVGLGTPREIPAGVVDGQLLRSDGAAAGAGALLTPADDGPNAAGAVVLTYHFWRSRCTPIPACWERRCGWRAHCGARSAVVSGCWSRRCPIRWRRRSSPTW
jgi:hypothetical protein